MHDPHVHKTVLAITQEILKTDKFLCALVSDPIILTWRTPFLFLQASPPLI
jgi:hypothetical protein